MFPKGGDAPENGINGGYHAGDTLAEYIWRRKIVDLFFIYWSLPDEVVSNDYKDELLKDYIEEEYAIFYMRLSI